MKSLVPMFWSMRACDLVLVLDERRIVERVVVATPCRTGRRRSTLHKFTIGGSIRLAGNLVARKRIADELPGLFGSARVVNGLYACACSLRFAAVDRRRSADGERSWPRCEYWNPCNAP